VHHRQERRHRRRRAGLGVHRRRPGRDEVRRLDLPKVINKLPDGLIKLLLLVFNYPFVPRFWPTKLLTRNACSSDLFFFQLINKYMLTLATTTIHETKPLQHSRDIICFLDKESMISVPPLYCLKMSIQALGIFCPAKHTGSRLLNCLFKKIRQFNIAIRKKT
jgi:hypothetical protein